MKTTYTYDFSSLLTADQQGLVPALNTSLGQRFNSIVNRSVTGSTNGFEPACFQSFLELYKNDDFNPMMLGYGFKTTKLLEELQSFVKGNF